MARRRRRRSHLSGSRKRACKFGVNKRTGSCLKSKRKRR